MTDWAYKAREREIERKRERVKEREKERKRERERHTAWLELKLLSKCNSL